VPVLRWKRDRDWSLLDEATRRAECEAWLRDTLRPALAGLRQDRAWAVGMDFALVQDLSVIWPALIEQDTSLRTPFTIELRTIPYEQQKMILWELLSALRRKRGVALDARGNGMVLAQETASRFGAVVHQVMLTEAWYREHMPPLRRAFEEGTIDVPQDEDTIDDFPMLRMVRGVIRVPDKRQRTEDGDRHGDAAMAAALMHFASRQDAEAYGYQAVVPPDRARPRRPEDEDEAALLERSRGIRGRLGA
jgi:phage FluMu gp28-like protein